MPVRLLVASIGNPAPYHGTFHSAGHILLEALRQLLAYPPLARDRSFSSGLVSHGASYTLYQSSSAMNTSGANVATAFNSFRRSLSPEERASARLVILHDELESPLGKVKLKTHGSPRGHNGIKSCLGRLQADDLVRIGVGIGRPEGRTPDVVAEYVLTKMTSQQRMEIANGAPAVSRILEKLSE